MKVIPWEWASGSSIFLFCLSIVLFIFNYKSKARLMCVFAMAFCLVGDYFMANAFHIDGMLSTVIGASGFIVGHLFYGNMFYIVSKEKGGKFFNAGFYIGLVVTYLPLLVMLIIHFAKYAEPNWLYVAAIPVYTTAIGVNLCCCYSYSWKLKNWRAIILVFGITLFYLTDIWIFFKMFGITEIFDTAVWHFYPIGQLLIILFPIPILKKKEIK